MGLDGICQACGDPTTTSQATAPNEEVEDEIIFAVVTDQALTGSSAPMCVPDACCIDPNNPASSDNSADEDSKGNP